MKASIIITSFNRSHLLKFGLASLARQNLSQIDTEVIVLNDGDSDGSEEVCKSFSKDLNIKYFQSMRADKTWRIPGFAINFGVKQSSGDFLFISCAEIYHLDNTVEEMLQAFGRNGKILAITQGRDDDGKYLAKLEANQSLTDNDYEKLPILENIHLPFFMGMNREDFFNIRGYDEEFIGFAFDDNDIVDRMKIVGNSHFQVKSRIVHLYHPRLNFADPQVRLKIKFNECLWNYKRNLAIRNTKKDWGNSF